MDPSLGDRKTSLWRTEDRDKKGKKDREAKKPHWLVAKEAGKRKNGSEKRRKRSEAPAAAAAAPAAAPPASKKRRAAREEALQVAQLPAEEQAAWLWGQLRGRVAGVVEARAPPAAAFVAAVGATLGERIRAAAAAAGAEVWEGACRAGPQRRTARVLVVAAGAVRCVQIIAELRALLPEGAPAVAKLWAKHMDPEEQKTHLATHYCGIGVGTPNRVGKLFADESLTLSHTALLVVDCQANAKQQTVFSLPETAADLCALLALCLKRLAKGSLKIAFC